MSALSDTRKVHIYITDDVISKVRRDLVDKGELKETVLRELQANWKSKMSQAGLISDTIESSSNPISKPTPIRARDQNSPSGNAETNDQWKPLMDILFSPKREQEYMPQQDGSNNGDIVTEQNTDASNDENDEEFLNDDDDEEDGIDDDMDAPHMVLCQFTNVKHAKNKWKCQFNSGTMQINGESLLFTKADGTFIF